MNTTIWKTEIKVQDSQEIEVPILSRILSVQADVLGEKIFMWFECNPLNPKDSKTIRVFGTGQLREGSFMGDFLGTVQLLKGAAVFHVFEELKSGK